MNNFADHLFEAVARTNCRVVVGMDPRLSRIPTSFLHPDATGDCPSDEAVASSFRSFGKRVIELIAGKAPAMKIQVAFFEAYGVPGMQAYADLVTAAHDAELMVIGDVKRGDIGSTAAAYAQGHSGNPKRSADLQRTPAPFGVDAVTVNPYFGWDGIEPFLSPETGRNAGIFVLVRTSNPSAPTFQDVRVGDRPFFEIVAKEVSDWGSRFIGDSGYSSVGAVAGGTYPAELGRLRSLLPHTPLLVPGFGAQGAGAKDVAPAFDENGLGAVINASRSILFAHEESSLPFDDALIAALENSRDEINQAAKMV